MRFLIEFNVVGLQVLLKSEQNEESGNKVVGVILRATQTYRSFFKNGRAQSGQLYGLNPLCKNKCSYSCRRLAND
jgi:hypothetical protein